MNLKIYLNSNMWQYSEWGLSKQYRPIFSIFLRSMQCGFDNSSGYLGLRYVKPKCIS